jgi:CheY-like chemotaxis protein
MLVFETPFSGVLPANEVRRRWNSVPSNGNLPRPNGSTKEYSKPRIMIVDDEKKIASLYAAILEAAGYEVTHIVGDGLEAVDTIKKNQNVDLIIMDQKMPKMGGIEATDKIKEIKPDIKVIMISAYEIPKPNRGSFAAILEKPISKSQLLECIRRA